jgi:SAM-dependent methyltransferase
MFEETADIETASLDYARRFSGTTGKWLLSRQTEILLDMVSEFQDATVLDVGGGHGQIAFPLCQRGFKLTVTGSSQECSFLIKELIENKSCDFVIADNINLPFPDNSFDIVTCFRLICHCNSWQKLIKELCRVARSCVIADYPTIYSVNLLAPKMFKLKKKIEGNTRIFTLFTHREIIDTFKREGFECLERKGEFFFPLALHRALKSKYISTILEAPFRYLRITDLIGSPVIVKMGRNKRN